MWLQGLPLRADELESKLACVQLCDGVERGDALIVGESYRNVAHVLRVMADIFIAAAATTSPSAVVAGPVSADEEACLVHPSTLVRMQGIVRQMLTGGVSQDMLQSLTLEQQQALQRVL